MLVSDPKSKANILNKQYKSVFSHEDPDHAIPEPNEPEYPAMKDIRVTEEGVLKLLSDLVENKASGPDQIPAKILKTAEDHSPDASLLFSTVHSNQARYRMIGVQQI